MSRKKIYFFVGTTAELIKLFPLMREMQHHNLEYKIIASGQNKLDKDILEKSGIGDVDIFLFKGVIKQTTVGLMFWFVKTLFYSLWSLKREFRANKGSYLVVHGDTISTVMGALLGKIYRMEVVHVEAGLRSFNYLKPFPEEIDRVIVSKLTKIHFCPNAWALENLKNQNGIKVDTGQNTLLDSLNFALTVDVKSKLYETLHDKDFFIFVFHRQENLYNQKLMLSIFEKIVQFSKNNIKCLLILHAPTREAMIRYGIWDLVEQESNIILSERLGYFEFMNIFSMAKFLISDGGSNQEEAYYFGKPCLILRKETERNEGLNGNVVLSGFEASVIDDFLNNYSSFERNRVVASKSPSSIVVQSLLD